MSYEAWHGNAFDTILSDGVLQLIDISGEGWAIALLPNLVGAGLLVATMLDASFGRRMEEIERDVAAFARESNGGLIVTASSEAVVHRELIIMLAARHRLPAVYPFRYFVTEGGLISYGPDSIDLFRRAAGYVDRILKGEKAADLPVQAPTKYELAINLKTALGLNVTPLLLARADQVIE